MKIFGELEEVSLEQLASDPVANTEGRLYQNTTTKKTMVDDGVAKKALLRNDDNMVIGNDVTPANNTRIHKALDEQLQIARGDDTTAEGTGATDLGQLGARIENVLAVNIPPVGNEGRLNYVTDEKTLAVDDGVATRRVVPEFSADDATAGGTIELAPVTSSVVRLTGSFSTLAEIPAGYQSQRVTLINRTGADVSISNESGATAEHRILTGTGANSVFKEDSAMSFYYDGVTERWQVVGEAAGAASGGGQVPSSTVVVATTNYTVLITDDIVLADASLGPLQLTLPSAAGNIGKRLLFQKIDANVRLPITILGTINGLVDNDIRETDAPFEIASDGANWKTVSAPAGEIFLTRPLKPVLGLGEDGPFTLAAIGSVAQGNVDLETLAAGSNIDNAIVKVSNKILLKHQTALEENGIYTVPSSPITIAASSVGNEDISTIANGSVINVTVVSTGQLISLRFQTDPQENGIYVVGATPGTTVRDQSLRTTGFTSITAFKDLLVYPDWWNADFTSQPNSPTDAGGTHTNDRKIFRQTNEVLAGFPDLTWSDAVESITVKIPVHAKTAIFDIVPFGGSGGGARPANIYGGSGGGGALGPGFPIRQRVQPGGNIVIILPLGARPGSGRVAGVGEKGEKVDISISGDSGGEVWNMAVLGGGGLTSFNWIIEGGAAANTITLVTAATIPKKGGGVYTYGHRYQILGEATFLANGGFGNTIGGSRAGGGGGAGAGPGGHGGAGFAGANAMGYWGQNATGYGGGGGGGGAGGSGAGRAGRGGFAGPGYVRITWE